MRKSLLTSGSSGKITSRNTPLSDEKENALKTLRKRFCWASKRIPERWIPLAAGMFILAGLAGTLWALSSVLETDSDGDAPACDSKGRNVVHLRLRHHEKHLRSLRSRRLHPNVLQLRAFRFRLGIRRHHATLPMVVRTLRLRTRPPGINEHGRERPVRVGGLRHRRQAHRPDPQECDSRFFRGCVQ